MSRINWSFEAKCGREIKIKTQKKIASTVGNMEKGKTKRNWFGKMLGNSFEKSIKKIWSPKTKL
jgi:hypothetical protein